MFTWTIACEESLPLMCSTTCSATDLKLPAAPSDDSSGAERRGFFEVFPYTSAEIPPTGAPAGFDSAAMIDFRAYRYTELPLRSG